MLCLKVAVLLVVVAVSTANVAPGSALTKVSSAKMVTKVADLTERKVVTTVAAAKKAVPAPATPNYTETLKMVGLFMLWYSFNAGYNVYNAYVKKDFQFPWATSALQLFVGMLYAFPVWGLKLRAVPKLTVDDIKTILPIAMLNAAGHSCAVVAMFEKGGGSFTHVIKASEPVVSVLLNFLVNKVVPNPVVAATLLPITYGVAYASTLGDLNPKTMSKELTSKAARLAMGSNVAFAMRSILRKNLTKDFKARTNLTPQNEHAVTTLLSGLLTVPFVLAFESVPAMSKTFHAMKDSNAFLMNMGICGMSFYLYNEMQNVVLGSLGPVPTAVGNTLKRVFIFLALYLFTAGETFPPAKVLGCAIAVAGCLAFAVAEAKTKKHH